MCNEEAQVLWRVWLGLRRDTFGCIDCFILKSTFEDSGRTRWVAREQSDIASRQRNGDLARRESRQPCETLRKEASTWRSMTPITETRRKHAIEVCNW
jgi:hypothetical protein